MTIGINIKNRNLSDYVTTVTLDGDKDTFNRQLAVTMINTVDGRKRAFYVEEGDPITFFYGGKKLFNGIVFKQGLSSEGNLTITAYDSNIYLTKSSDSRVFIKKKASEIIRILCKDFGIKTGPIADTGYVIPYLKVSNATLADIILKALTITRKQTGKRFFVGNNLGDFNLYSSLSSTRYIIRDGDNLISASYSRSIEATKTQAKVIGGAKGKETVVIAKDDTKRKKYGVMQVVEEMDEKATASQIKQRAQAILKMESNVDETMSVEALGVPEVMPGTPLYVYNTLAALRAGYYATAVKHTFTDAMHTMSLDLARSYELPAIDVSSDETTPPKPEDKKKDTKKK